MPVKPKATLSEIAKQAGTHLMAVSVVLNGSRSNTRVSDATRRRIQQIASDLNYVPNANARGLKRQRTNTIGVLFNWAGSHMIHSFYSVSVLEGIVGGAAAAGYHILLYTKSWRDAQTSTATFSDSRTDGVVVVAPQEDSDIVPTLTRLGLPLVLVSSATDVPGVPFITIDNIRAVSLALSHLHSLGHTRIAYISSVPGRHSLRERREGFIAWMAERGLAVPEEYLVTDLNPVIDERNRDKLCRLLTEGTPPTAVLAFNDDLAIQLLDVARSLGLDLPAQLSVVGVDDILAAALTTPKLTTARLPHFAMGSKAAQLLIDVIEGREAREMAHVVHPELIVRESTAPPPA